MVFIRELRKQVMGCSGGSDCASKGLVDYLQALFSQRCCFAGHVSFEISSVVLNMEVLVLKNIPLCFSIPYLLFT